MVAKAWGGLSLPGNEPIPEFISRRQFFQILANKDLVSREDALVGMGGGLPAGFEALVDAIADDELQWQARAMLIGARDFYRANGFVDYIGAMYGLDKEAIDQLWREAAKID